MTACPRCSGPLTEESRADGVVVERCRHGAFLAGEEVADLLDDAARDNVAKALEHGRMGVVCPSCRKTMRIVDVTVDGDKGAAHVEIDVCAACHALWFDAGELEAVKGQAALTKGRKSTGYALAALWVWLMLEPA
ncbi:MAG TPA: zf-TFIIB domain-containing protein [Candidatus Thermoplasmatota archaeon]|nr:zf-TFIIB domain-containing protein [Candidatus Thermoplasmatota archaeon]